MLNNSHYFESVGFSVADCGDVVFSLPQSLLLHTASRILHVFPLQHSSDSQALKAHF